MAIVWCLEKAGIGHVLPLGLLHLSEGQKVLRVCILGNVHLQIWAEALDWLFLVVVRVLHWRHICHRVLILWVLLGVILGIEAGKKFCLKKLFVVWTREDGAAHVCFLFGTMFLVNVPAYFHTSGVYTFVFERLRVILLKL